MKHIWLVATTKITLGAIGTVNDGDKFTCPEEIAGGLLRSGKAVRDGHYIKKQRPLHTKSAGGAVKQSASSPAGQVSAKGKSTRSKSKKPGAS